MQPGGRRVGRRVLRSDHGALLCERHQPCGHRGDGARARGGTRRIEGRAIIASEGLHADLTYRRKAIDVRQNKFWHPETLWPCQQPPWGVLSSIDLATGDYDWQVPLGEVPELTAQGVPPTGTINMGGPIVTAGGLLFIGGSNDRRFRAFDTASGRVLWEGRLEGSGHANPMTYIGPESGRQFVVIAAGGGNKLSHRFTDALQAFALPG